MLVKLYENGNQSFNRGHMHFSIFEMAQMAENCKGSIVRDILTNGESHRSQEYCQGFVRAHSQVWLLALNEQTGRRTILMYH